MPLDGTDVIERTVSLWAVVPQDKQMYLRGQSFIMGCSATGWNRCIWEANVPLWAVVPQDGKGIRERPKFHYGQ